MWQCSMWLKLFSQWGWSYEKSHVSCEAACITLYMLNSKEDGSRIEQDGKQSEFRIQWALSSQETGDCQESKGRCSHMRGCQNFVSNNIWTYQNRLISAPRKNPSVKMMHSFFQPKTTFTPLAAVNNLPKLEKSMAFSKLPFERYIHYLSDMLNDDEDLNSNEDEDHKWASDWEESSMASVLSTLQAVPLAAQPPHKRRKLDVSYQV